MNFKDKTTDELLERRSAILTESEQEGADLKALRDEVRAINEELEARRTAESQRAEIRGMVADGAGEQIHGGTRAAADPREKRAQQLRDTGAMTIPTEETRAILISSEDLATPTQVSEIHDAAEEDASSLLSYVFVDDCEGMGSDKVPYVVESAGEAGDQTEGAEAATKEPNFDYVTIYPDSIAAKAQISKQARKQTANRYAKKVTDNVGKALRKKAIAKIVAALKASELTMEYIAELSGSNGTITESTLSDLYLNYLGEGTPTLLLSRADLRAFSKVRGTNEKKRLYKIDFDKNPNTGIIEEDGIACRFIVVPGLTACAGTAKGANKQKTMFFGDLKTVKLDLFSPMEVEVSHEFAIDKLMDTIVGDAEVGCDVVAKNTIIAVTIPATA